MRGRRPPGEGRKGKVRKGRGREGAGDGDERGEGILANTSTNDQTCKPAFSTRRRCSQDAAQLTYKRKGPISAQEKAAPWLGATRSSAQARRQAARQGRTSSACSADGSARVLDPHGQALARLGPTGRSSGRAKPSTTSPRRFRYARAGHDADVAAGGTAGSHRPRFGRQLTHVRRVPVKGLGRLSLQHQQRTLLLGWRRNRGRRRRRSQWTRTRIAAVS